MRKLFLSLFFILFWLTSFSQQVVGIGGQYTSGADGQLALSLSLPYYVPEGTSFLLTGGVEATTSGGAKMSGIQVKPIQATISYDERMKPYSFAIGVDAGYLFDIRGGRKDAFLLDNQVSRKDAFLFTPNVYADYYCFFVKSGYEWDPFNNRGQFYIRLGIGYGAGAYNMID